MFIFFFFSSRRRHTRYWRDWSSDVCSSDLRRLLRAAWWDWPAELVTRHVRDITAGTPRKIEAIAREAGLLTDRKSVVEGKSVDLGGRRIIKKKKKKK